MRHIAYLIIALNAVFVAALITAGFLFGSHHPPPLAELRAKVEASSSFEDLRPRALNILSADEAANRAILHLHGAITHLSRLGILLSVSNAVLLYLLIRRALREDAKT